MVRALGRLLGKTGSGVLRFVLGLATGIGGTNLLLSTGGALIIASFALLLEAPLLFRIPFSIGAFLLAFVAVSRLLGWLASRR